MARSELVEKHYNRSSSWMTAGITGTPATGSRHGAMPPIRIMCTMAHLRLQRIVARPGDSRCSATAGSAAGYYDGPIDGALGPMTREAIAAYQADNGLSVTSAIDEPTLATLGLV